MRQTALPHERQITPEPPRAAIVSFGIGCCVVAMVVVLAVAMSMPH